MNDNNRKDDDDDSQQEDDNNNNDDINVTNDDEESLHDVVVTTVPQNDNNNGSENDESDRTHDDEDEETQGLYGDGSVSAVGTDGVLLSGESFVTHDDDDDTNDDENDDNNNYDEDHDDDDDKDDDEEESTDFFVVVDNKMDGAHHISSGTLELEPEPPSMKAKKQTTINTNTTATTTSPLKRPQQAAMSGMNTTTSSQLKRPQAIGTNSRAVSAPATPAPTITAIAGGSALATTSPPNSPSASGRPRNIRSRSVTSLLPLRQSAQGGAKRRPSIKRDTSRRRILKTTALDLETGRRDVVKEKEASIRSSDSASALHPRARLRRQILNILRPETVSGTIGDGSGKGLAAGAENLLLDTSENNSSREFPSRKIHPREQQQQQQRQDDPLRLSATPQADDSLDFKIDIEGHAAKQKVGVDDPEQDADDGRGLIHRSSNHHRDSNSNELGMHGRLKVSLHRVDSDAGADDAYHQQQSTVQYRLQAVSQHDNTPRLLRWIGCTRRSNGSYGFQFYEDSGRSPCDRMVIGYLHWVFTQTFSMCMLTAAIGFFTLTFMFALIFWRIGRNHPTCIGGVDYASDYFTDAYALSWTTFSTVGYGLIYSGISADEPDIRKCTGITILVTLEAFIGVLFASMCGAILFSKIGRIQSFAQVQFSDPIVVRYGPGVMVGQTSDGMSDDGSNDGLLAEERIPCPVLEFRVVNRLHHVRGGEIIGATANIIASVNASQAGGLTKSKARKRRGKKGKGRKVPTPLERLNSSFNSSFSRPMWDVGSKGDPQTATDEDADSAVNGNGHDHGERSSGWRRRRKKSSGHSVHGSSVASSDTASEVEALSDALPPAAPKIHQTFEEDPTGDLVSRLVFSKLELESPDHPFFKRVWLIRHTLDKHSPLIHDDVRMLIRNNDGYWPPELNSHEQVRAAISFNEIVVSVSGTCNADANPVYAQKVYDYVDLSVGYRFVNMLYRREVDDSLQVDTSLLNDVTEQAGGGGEPLLGKRNRGRPGFARKHVSFVV